MPAHAVGPNTCQLCALDGLTFTAMAMYCTSCGAQIKHRLTYYWIQDGMGARYCFCTICFRKSRGGNISFRGLSFSKTKLHKDKNTEESGEAVRLVSLVLFSSNSVVWFSVSINCVFLAVGTM